jgi:signal transduction histidine kinase
MFLQLSEFTSRIVVMDFAQCALGVIMFFIFRHFSKIYIRRFLRSWSRSWLAFAVYMFCSSVNLAASASEGTVVSIILGFMAQLGCYSQIFLVLMGTYQLINERPIKRKTHQQVIIACVLLALVTVLAFNQNPDAIAGRYLLRIGTRTFIPACGFLFAGIVVWYHHKFTQGFGKNLLAVAFILYSIDQFIYFSIVIANLFSYRINVPEYFGLIDLLLISLMGLGKVMWLLENERHKLNNANKELDNFLYSTSHDLRSPIASILGITFLGKLELQEEKAREFMVLIEDRIKKLDVGIASILSLARSKKFGLKMEEIDFNLLLDDTILDVKFNKGASAVSLIYDRSAQNHFISDFHQMKIILGNLISNAVKYHNLDQPNPYIKVVFTKKEGHLEIDIEDNGQGISAENLPKIFDMFYRGADTKSTEGTGLGLYIVQEALNKIKGHITVKSDLGKGSIFTLHLENPEVD